MARILYGVMGDSRGHLSRSLAVARELPRHEFLFAGGGCVREAASAGHRHVDLPMLSTIHSNHRVDLAATISNALRLLVGQKPVIERLAGIMKDFDPDLIISDYEFFTPLAARKTGRPCISLDHQHILTHCACEVPGGQALNRLLTALPVNFLYSFAQRFLISSFYRPRPIDEARTEVFPPILRNVVKEHRPSNGGHILVYLLPSTLSRLVPLFQTGNRRFIVYRKIFGNVQDAVPEHKNIVVKEFSTHGFLEDLASCRYVISNGGHSLISEALYYQKPVLCFPIELFYEQLLNAYYLERHGFGAYHVDPDCRENLLDDFEGGLAHYRARIGEGRFFGNNLVASRLEEFIASGLPA